MSSFLPWLAALTLIAGSYLVGSIPFAVVVSKAMGLQDPRTFGSGNPGATNVLRTGNRKAALLTLIGDAAKGWVAVWATATLAPIFGAPSSVVGLSAIAAFLGHVYPVFLGFKGGKGVATALGVVLALNPWLGLATALTWLLVAYTTRYSSLSSILAAISAPLYYFLGAGAAWPMQGSFVLALLVLCAVLLVRHQANISRLLQGKEPRIGQGKK
ncbi:MAG: glycerol-3-phosphate 1-O-acyltransferase PlsY [Alcaligenaceae bacterium]|nr:glycerol-3-phosphate 1-O-acyltransferase PlsY [Alcaligenaceae bacterium]